MSCCRIGSVRWPYDHQALGWWQWQCGERQETATGGVWIHEQARCEILDLPRQVRCWSRVSFKASQITDNWLFVQQLVRARSKGNVKAPYHRPFVRGPSYKGSIMRKLFPRHDVMFTTLITEAIDIRIWSWHFLYLILRHLHNMKIFAWG